MSFRSGQPPFRSGGGTGNYGSRESTISVDIPTFPSVPTSLSHHGSMHSSSNPSVQDTPKTSWFLERAESWFGSVETFENNVVLVSRVGLVDCITYPFIVFSRQCQLFPYNPASMNAAAPFSTIVVMHHIMNSQGVAALWRGWKSHVFLLLVRPFMDAFLLKLSSRSGSVQSSGLKYWLTSFVFKSLTHVVTMPLLSYAYHEMAQHTKDKVFVGIMETAVDRPLFRMDAFRSVPYLTLTTPTILHGVLFSITSHITHKTLQRLFPNRTPRNNILSSTVRALTLDYISFFLTDILLYPLETVLVRLYCQGMPALVENVENGVDTAFIGSYYNGFIDCASGILDSEGPLGFFKGFSSLLIRYAVHGGILIVLWRTMQALDNRLKR